MNKNIIGHIYVLHFNRPFKHAKHYIGWTEKLVDRLDAHEKGNGSKLMRAVKEAQIGFSVANVFVGTRDDERKMKKQKNGPRFCQLCKRK